MKFNWKDKKEYFRIIKFGAVGAFNTAVDWGIFALMVDVFSVDATFSQAVAYFIGAVNSFICNKYFTFKSKTKITLSETIKFLIVTAIALAISVVAVDILTNLGWNKYIAKIPATALSLGVNFIGNRFVVFSKAVDDDK